MINTILNNERCSLNAIKKSSISNKDLIEGGHSCSLKGGVIFCTGISDIIPVIHASPGCSIHSYLGSLLMEGKIYNVVATGICGNQIIFGGEDRLINAIGAAFSVYKPSLFYVIAGCQAATIGEDIDSAIAKAKEKYKITIPIVNSQTTSYDGNHIFGYVQAGIQLLKSLCKNQKIECKTVNLIGFPANYNVYWRGDMIEVISLLEMLGLKVHCVFPGNCTIEDIEKIPKAEANIVFDEQFGIAQAQFLKEKFGTPYVSPNFGCMIGADNTEEMLKDIVTLLKLDEKTSLTAIELRKKKAMQMARNNFFLWHEPLQNTIENYGLTAPAGLALGLVRLLTCEFGLEPKFVNLYPSYPGAVESLTELLKIDGRGFEPMIMENADEKECTDMLNGNYPKMILGRGATHMRVESQLEDSLLYKVITYPYGSKPVIYDRPLAGFNGVPMFLDEIVRDASYFL